MTPEEKQELINDVVDVLVADGCTIIEAYNTLLQEHMDTMTLAAYLPDELYQKHVKV